MSATPGCSPIRSARPTREHRVWQQLSYTVLGDGKGLTLTGRSRFEQRNFEGYDEVGLRYRQMLRLTAPLGDKGVRAVGWSETFLALDDTDWGQRGGFDRIRNFVGVSLPVAKGITFEPGYLNEYVNLAASDRMNHVASVTLNAVF